MKDVLFLPRLSGLADLALLILRMLVGAFLMWGTWDNISSPERMAEFVGFLTQLNCPAPEIAAPLSCYAQFLCGVLFILGLLTRWAGLVMVFNFIVAVLLAHMADDFRGQFPALILIAVSLYFATRGAGRYSVDAKLGAG